MSLTPAEALMLASFALFIAGVVALAVLLRRPEQGSRTKKFEQIGNAVCPPLAAAVLGALIGRPA